MVIKDANFKGKFFYKYKLTKNICQQTDVLYMTRVQKERVSVGSYELTKDNVSNFKKNMIVMHPFPRLNEIPTWFDTDPRAKYFKQITNGLLVFY